MKVRFLIFAIVLLVFSFSINFAQGKLKIVVSVDWEGEDLRVENLQSMKDFRRDYPEIPLQHFLNAAYYTKHGAKANEITEAIKSVLLPEDEHGLHIHAWKNLVEASDVTFRTTPSFVREGYMIADCKIDCGQEIALTGYSNAELRKIIARSIEILQKQGFNHPKSFRAGGWQADDNVLDALAEEGFTLDSSATPADFLLPEWGKYKLYQMVKDLWMKTTPTSQPYIYKTVSGLKILEYPNNSCLSDYMTGEDMLKVFQSNAQTLKNYPQKNVYLSIGFHQETAAEFLPHLRDAIKLIRDEAEQKQIPIEFLVPPLKEDF